MKKIHTSALCTLFFLLAFAKPITAQFFLATFEQDGMDLVFSISPNPGGGDITTGWSDIEFFVRYPAAVSGTFGFGAITVNTTDFPGVAIPNNGVNAQGVEAGFENNWFGTSFSTTPSLTYLEGMEYEVFRVTLDVSPELLGLELVHNEFFSPTYLALTSQSGSDLTNTGGLKFYGGGASSCNTCPGPTFNDILPLPLSGAPVELLDFWIQRAGSNVILYWETNTEINTDYFEVQRSAQGKNWQEAGRLSAAGFSTEPENYQWTDVRPFAFFTQNNEIYYRLKIVDQDKSFVYSDVKSVAPENNQYGQIFPNPSYAGQELTIQWTGNNLKSPVSITLSNLAGQKIFRTQVDPNDFPVSWQWPTEVSAGTYLIQLEQNGKYFFDKVVRLD